MTPNTNHRMSFILYLKVPPFPLFFMQIRLFEWGEACWRVSIGIPLKWKLERGSNGKWRGVEVWIISSWFVEAPFPSIGIQWFRQKNHEHDIKKKAPRKGKCNTFFQYLSIGKVEINFVILDEFELDEKTHLSFCCIFHRKPGKLILPRKWN